MNRYRLFSAKSTPQDGLFPMEDFVFAATLNAEDIHQALGYAIQFHELQDPEVEYVSLSLVKP